MTKKAITEVENKIKKMAGNRDAEITDLKERIRKAKQEMEKASKQMDVSMSKGSTEDYRKAKADYAEAEEEAAVLYKRLDILENKPIISESEYEKGIAQIMAALGEISEETKKQIVTHMEQIRILAAETNAEIARGNEVLRQWQHDIYKDKAEMKRTDGSMIHMANLERQFKDFSVAQFADFVLNSGYYETIARKGR